jgi:hypothetical protein
MFASARRFRAFGLAAGVLAAGCKLDLSYEGAVPACTPGSCPIGFECVDERCVPPGGTGDAGDDVGDADPGASDAPIAAIDCEEPGVILCDNFEDASLDPRWTPLVSNGTVAPDTTYAFDGQGALYLHTNSIAASGYAQAQVFANDTFGDDVFVRAFYYFPVATYTPSVNLLSATQNVSPYAGTSVALTGGDFYTFNNIPPSPVTTTSGVAMPIGQWVCVEYQVHIGNPGTVRVWVDGGAIEALTASQDTEASPRQSNVLFGLELGSGSAHPAFDAWVDHVVVAGRRIGCSD